MVQLIFVWLTGCNQQTDTHVCSKGPHLTRCIKTHLTVHVQYATVQQNRDTDRHAHTSWGDVLPGSGIARNLRQGVRQSVAFLSVHSH